MFWTKNWGTWYDNKTTGNPRKSGNMSTVISYWMTVTTWTIQPLRYHLRVNYIPSRLLSSEFYKVIVRRYSELNTVTLKFTSSLNLRTWLFGNRVIAEVISWGRTGIGWDQIPIWPLFFQEEERTHRETHRENGTWQWKQRLEWYTYKSENAKDSWQQPEAGRGAGDRFSLGAPRRSQLCQYLHFGLLASWTAREHTTVLRINYCGTLLQQPQESNTDHGTQKWGVAVTDTKNVEVTLELHNGKKLEESQGTWFLESLDYWWKYRDWFWRDLRLK